MYAIIADGGRQYKVEEGQELQIDFREDVETGAAITFDRVLLVSGEGGPKIGKPVVAGATVSAEVLKIEQGDKIFVQKYRRRKHYDKRTGHRQLYTRVKINKING